MIGIVPLVVLLATLNRGWEIDVYLLILGMAGVSFGGSAAVSGIRRLAFRVVDLMEKQDAL